MTAARAAGTRVYRPEPSRWWIHQVPTSWPAAAGRWTHLADRALGSTRSFSVPDLDAAAIADVLYLPPVDPEHLEAARGLADELRAAGLRVVTQSRCGEPEMEGRDELRVLDLLAPLVEHGVAALDALTTSCTSAVWPLIPGLTDRPDGWEAGLDLLASAGVEVVVPQTLELGPNERRDLAEFTDDEGYHALFHGPVPDEREFERAAAARGLATRPQRPRLSVAPRVEFCRQAAAELIVVADLWLRLERPEAAGQNLLRAARWVETFDQDLRAIAREGNLGVLPWLDDNALAVVEDLARERPSVLRRQLEDEYSGTSR